MNQKFGIGQVNLRHCVESIRIGRFSGPYSIQMQDNADQKNLEYRHFSLTGYHKQSQFNPFHETGFFLYPLKTQENQWFSDVSRGY